MIIKSIEIDGFGKFSKTTLNLQKGFNLILGNNEDGKTTLMSFIKMMFYSSSSNTKTADLLKSLRKKYRPWNGGPMQGAVEFEFDGMDYRIQKEFLKSEATDKTTIFCKTTGENIQIENKNEAGEHFFGMKLDEFERSVFVGQSGGFAADSSSDSLAIRIANLSGSGDENISHEVILKRLRDAAEELVSKSGKKGLLAEERNILEELRFEEQNLIQLENSQNSIELEISQLKSEILGIEEELNSISNEQKLDLAKKDLNAFYTLQNKQNLLNTVKNQMLAYGAPEVQLKEYAKNAKLLSDKIDNILTLIQELTVNQSTVTISDDEYAELSQLDEKAAKLRSDLRLINGKISDHKNEFNSKLIVATKKARLISILPFGGSLLLALIANFAGMSLSAFALPILLLGLAVSVIMYFTAKNRALTGLSLRLLRRDIENSIREISYFSDDMLSKSTDELREMTDLRLSDAISTLSEGLAKYHCSNISELRRKSIIAQAEDLQEVTQNLAAEKENFIALACTIRNVETYSAAKIMYIELCESLSAFDSLTNEIDTLCKATGIQDTSPVFVGSRIKELGEFIQSAPKGEEKQKVVSAEDLRKKLKEKRARLDECQKKIVIPQRNISEVRKLIVESEKNCGIWEKRLKEICAAINIMDEAIMDANKGLGSQLSERVGKYLAQISGEKYSDVLVPRNLNVEVRSSDSEAYREWKYMSQGAIDRIYLSLRLAMTDIIVGNHEALPVFFDDILSQYDDENCKNALIFLKSYIEDLGSASQILFFTCHGHIAQITKNVFSEYNETLL